MDLYLPILIMIAAVSGFACWLNKITLGVIQIFELGFFYALIVLFYFSFPLTVYLLNGMEFLPISDLRLFTAAPSPEEMSEIAWYYVVYILGFMLAYSLTRGKKAYQTNHLPREKTDSVRLTVTIVVYIVTTLLILIIRNIYDVGDVTTYGETFVVYWRLPTFVRQIYNHLTAIKVTVQILLIMNLVSKFKKYRHLIYGLILFELVNTVITLHSRSVLIFTVFSVLLAYHYYVRQLKTRHIVLVLIPTLVIFLLYGQLREGQDAVFSSLLSIFSHNECESVFGTLFDYNYKAKLGDSMAISYIQTWTSDLLNLIPQQMLSFEKMDISHTYSMVYIPGLDVAGGGFPGGTLLEAIMGLGLWDAFLKGAIIGSLFSYLYKKCMLEKRTYMKSAIYIWVMVLSYKTFSRGTFILIPSFFYDFLVPVVVIGILTQIFKVALKPIHPCPQVMGENVSHLLSPSGIGRKTLAFRRRL